MWVVTHVHSNANIRREDNASDVDQVDVNDYLKQELLSGLSCVNRERVSEQEVWSRDMFEPDLVAIDIERPHNQTYAQFNINKSRTCWSQAAISSSPTEPPTPSPAIPDVMPSERRDLWREGSRSLISILVKTWWFDHLLHRYLHHLHPPQAESEISGWCERTTTQNIKEVRT